MIGAAHRGASRPPRIQPGWGVGIVVFTAYAVVVVGLQATSGIDYDDWFDSAGNAIRAVLVSFAAGAILLAAFVAWARWDFVWRDPQRQRMGVILWAPVVLYTLAIGLGALGADRAGRSAELLAVIVLAGVLVGFAEELLFRGILLRCARATSSSEAIAFLIVTVWFGAFHFVNVILGGGLLDTVVQVVVVTLGGVAFYLFRRARGWLMTAIVAHALWNITVSLAPEQGRENLGSLLVTLLLLPALLAAAVAALTILTRDQQALAERPDGE
jgi:uncharacterized protein